jgi:hypothetical protein
VSADTDKLIAEAREYRGSAPDGCTCFTCALASALEAAEKRADEKLNTRGALIELHKRLEAAETQRDRVVRARNEIEATRDRAREDYRDCKEEGSHADASRYDCVASTYSTALRLLDAALAEVTPSKAQGA